MSEPRQKWKKKSGPPVSEIGAPIVGPLWLGWAFAVLALGVFVATTCGTIPGGDSGELISVAYNLGVAHPPGYPLFTLLGHLATYLPLGSVAWRVNVLSGLFAVLSGLVIFALVSQWLRDRYVALIAAGLFIFSPLAWRYSVVAEVFTFNNLIVASLLYVTFRFCEEPGPKWAVAWSAVLGLGCSNHHTILFLAIPLFVILVHRHGRILFRPKVFGMCLTVFSLGFLPYLYVPWAAQKKLMISWGDASTWDGFWTHFFRREYGTFQLASGGRDYFNVFSNLKFYFLDIFYQLLYVGVLAALLGIWQIFKGDKRGDPFARVLLWGFLIYVVGFHFLANMDLSNHLLYDVQSRFWLVPNLILVLFVAVGLKALARRWSQWPVWASPLVVIVVLAAQIGLHYRHEDQSRNTIFYDLGKSLLDGMPAGGMSLNRGDVYVNAIRYLQSVENYRTDVISIPLDLLWWPWMKGVVEANYPQVRFPGRIYRYRRLGEGEFTLKDFFAVNQTRFPSFVGKLADYEIKNLEEVSQLVPVGYLNRVYPKGTPFDFAAYQADVTRFAGFQPPSRSEIRDKSWEAFIYYNFWDRELEKSKMLFDIGFQKGPNLDIIHYGGRILERVVVEYPEAPPLAWRNLGVAFQFLAKSDVRFFPKMIWAWREYLAFNPTNDEQLSTIQRAVQMANESHR